MKRSVLYLCVGILGLVIVAACADDAASPSSSSGAPRPTADAQDVVEVPNVEGLDLEEAGNALAARGLVVPPHDTAIKDMTGAPLAAGATTFVYVPQISIPPVKVLEQLPRPAARVAKGTTVAMRVTVPLSRDQFLRDDDTNPLVTHDTAESAAAYYATIDRASAKDTLAKWKTANGFGTPADSEADAVYANKTDLGFGRHMYMRRRGGRVSMYVDNYKTVDDAVAGEGLVATVAMEYAPNPTTRSSTKRFTQFFTFGGDGKRISSIDLDGHGEKSPPSLCTACHGGRASSKLATVGSTMAYENDGDIGSRFIPFDVATLGFSTTKGFTRAEQEPQFKKLNEAIAATYATSFDYSGPAIPIPAASVRIIEFPVSGQGAVRGLSLSFGKLGETGLNHPDLSELSITLSSPSGKSVSLLDTPSLVSSFRPVASAITPKSPYGPLVAMDVRANGMVELIRRNNGEPVTLVSLSIAGTFKQEAQWSRAEQSASSLAVGADGARYIFWERGEVDRVKDGVVQSLFLDLTANVTAAGNPRGRIAGLPNGDLLLGVSHDLYRWSAPTKQLSLAKSVDLEIFAVAPNGHIVMSSESSVEIWDDKLDVLETIGSGIRNVEVESQGAFDGNHIWAIQPVVNFKQSLLHIDLFDGDPNHVRTMTVDVSPDPYRRALGIASPGKIWVGRGMDGLFSIEEASTGAHDLREMMFDDSGPTDVTSAPTSGVGSGIFRGYGLGAAAPLAGTFAGEDPNGTWRLEIVNYSFANVGTFHHASLHFSDDPGAATQASARVIDGWYGGTGYPTAFDDTFVPFDWSAEPVLYRTAVSKTCRLCHGQLDASRDFASWDQFQRLASRSKSKVFDDATMPLSEKSFLAFWLSYPSQPRLVSKAISDAFGKEQFHGPGLPRSVIRSLGVVKPGTSVVLDGSHSPFAKAFMWQQTGGMPIALNGATTATLQFLAPGAAAPLRFSLQVSDGTTSNTSAVDLTVGP